MKRFILAILTVLMGLSTYAQSDSLRQAYSRIQTLEQTIADQTAKINKLSSDVQSVLKMNNDLKNTLEIGKPKYESKSGDMEYTISTVTGNPDKNEVQVVMYAKNAGSKETSVNYMNPNIVDEKGVSHDKFGDYEVILSGNEKSIPMNVINYPAGVPFQINMTIKGITPDTHFLKYLALHQRFGDDAVFQNLTIDWTSED